MITLAYKSRRRLDRVDFILQSLSLVFIGLMIEAASYFIVNPTLRFLFSLALNIPLWIIGYNLCVRRALDANLDENFVPKMYCFAVGGALLIAFGLSFIRVQAIQGAIFVTGAALVVAAIAMNIALAFSKSK